MDFFVGVRSGVVEVVYLVLFELVGLHLLFWAVEKISRQVGKGLANEKGRLNLISSRWTEIFGRGSIRTGHILRAGSRSVSVVSLLMLNFGTNGLTRVAPILEEAVYVGTTSDVESQLRFFGNVLQSRESNLTIGYYEMWWDMIDACRKSRPQETTVYASFCSTSPCRKAFRESEGVLTDDGFDFTQANQIPDHHDNFRCNDGRDAPELILSIHPQIGPEIDLPSIMPLEFTQGSWTQILVELDLPDKLYKLEETFGEEDAFNGWKITCVYMDRLFNRRFVNCIAYYVPGEGDVIVVGSMNSPQGETWHDDDGLSLTIDIATMTYTEFPGVDGALLGSNRTEWMIALNVLAILNEVPALEYVRHINSVLKLGPHSTEFRESAVTEISTVASVGAVILGSALVFALFGLLICRELGRRKSYLNLNLGLEDSELFCLMINHRDDHCDCKEVRSVDIGISRDQERWGILCDEDLAINPDLGLRELRQRKIYQGS